MEDKEEGTNDENRYVYHFKAYDGRITFDGIVQLKDRITSHESLERVRRWIAADESRGLKMDSDNMTIDSLSYLGREKED